MSDYEKEFIKRVRKEIAVLGLTMDAVGKAIGSSRQVLSQILNGKFNSMRADTMLKLAKLLKISLDEIIGIPGEDLISRSEAMHAVLHNDGDAARVAIADIKPVRRAAL